MNGFFRQVNKKLNSKSGVSLGETMVAMLIMLMVTGLLTSTVKLANEQYARQRSLSEANVLVSTLNSILTDELGYATSVTLEDNDVKSFVAKSYITVEQESILSDFGGKLVFMNEEDSGDRLELLSRSSYPNGMSVTVDSFKFFKDKQYFTVVLKVFDAADNEILQKSLDILAVNELGLDS